MKLPLSASGRAIAVWVRMAAAGVRNRGCTEARKRGPKPSRASANRYLGPASTEPPLVPRIEITAPAVSSHPPQSPRKFRAPSASGVAEVPRSGTVPRAAH